MDKAGRGDTWGHWGLLTGHHWRALSRQARPGREPLAGQGEGLAACEGGGRGGSSKAPLGEVLEELLLLPGIRCSQTLEVAAANELQLGYRQHLGCPALAKRLVQLWGDTRMSSQDP